MMGTRACRMVSTYPLLALCRRRSFMIACAMPKTRCDHANFVCGPTSPLNQLDGHKLQLWPSDQHTRYGRQFGRRVPTRSMSARCCVDDWQMGTGGLPFLRQGRPYLHHREAQASHCC